jgi:hypothetical protein
MLSPFCSSRADFDLQNLVFGYDISNFQSVTEAKTCSPVMWSREIDSSLCDPPLKPASSVAPVLESLGASGFFSLLGLDAIGHLCEDDIFAIDGPPIVINNGVKRKASGSEGDAAEAKKSKARKTRDGMGATEATRSDTPGSKRTTHNVLERKRRNDLKYCYALLKAEIPSLANTDRAATSLILSKATDLVELQKREHLVWYSERKALHNANEALRASKGLPLMGDFDKVFPNAGNISDIDKI